MFVFLNIKNESAESGWLSAPILAGNLDLENWGSPGFGKLRACALSSAISNRCGAGFGGLRRDRWMGGLQ